MCWQCDNPAATTAEYLGFARGLIDRHGWAVQGVESSRVHPPWSHTVGLTALGAPELVVTGMPHARAAAVLNGIAEHLVHSVAPSAGNRVTLADGPRVEFVELARPRAHLNTAVAIFGLAVSGLRIARFRVFRDAQIGRETPDYMRLIAAVNA